jgi:hypothetical protein
MIVSVLLLVALLPACGDKAADPQAASQASGAAESAGAMPTVVNTAEYVLYQNIFKNNTKSEYSGKEAVKKGTFATLYDAFNNVERYYVWGYNDQTKCCDWQWELKFDDESDLPSNGSLITVRGTYEENEAALDKFWIIHPEITVEKVFPGREYDIDMQAMDNTLERVQTANIVRKAEAFEGMTVCGYGRILNDSTLQDPYYDGSWTINISGDYELPAFGTLVLISGTVQDGSIANCELAPNTQY